MSVNLFFFIFDLFKQDFGTPGKSEEEATGRLPPLETTQSQSKCEEQTYKSRRPMRPFPELGMDLIQYHVPPHLPENGLLEYMVVLDSYHGNHKRRTSLAYLET